VRRSQASKRRLKVGIIGCGAIGSILAKTCVNNLKNKVDLIGICDIDAARAEALKKKLKINISVLPLNKLIRKSGLIIEAAAAGFSGKIAIKAVSAGKDIMVMSVGGLLNRVRLFEKAKKKGCRVYLPSGAICGLDGVKAAKIGKIKSATLVTRKPPGGLEGAPYIKQKGINLKAIKKDRIIFSGSASEAVKNFPKNINVSAVLSLAGIGAKKTDVNIIVSPESKRNIHEIELKGDFGRIFTRCENVPSKANPKTSMLAALSAIATLKEILEPVRIGT